MKEYKNFALLSVLVLVVLAFSYGLTTSRVHAPVSGADTGAPLTFEIVRTPEAHAKGLGGRAEIPHDYGMLFVFQKADTYSFWMKDMLVPIDILWLHDDGTILKIDREISPSTYPSTTFSAPANVRLVLELRAGEAQRHGWSVGDTIALPKDWQN